MSSTRREAIVYSLGNLLFSACNFDSCREKPLAVPDNDYVTAGNLHFLLTTDFMGESETKQVANGVEAVFARERILFRGVHVTRTFPQLDLLDRLIYVVDSEIIDGQQKDGTDLPYGIWGVKDIPNYNYLTKLEEHFRGIPYDKTLSEANTGLMIADRKVRDKHCVDRKDNYDLHQQLSILINLALHEIGHGFTANHVCGRTDKGSDPRSCRFPLGHSAPYIQHFHPRNVAKMRNYIREIISKPKHYADAETRLAEWKRRYHKDNDNKNCGIYV